jgi:hypothetical protein
MRWELVEAGIIPPDEVVVVALVTCTCCLSLEKEYPTDHRPPTTDLATSSAIHSAALRRLQSEAL